MKIVCIGRNYVAHAKELHNDVPSEPVIFLKPESALNQTSNLMLNEKLGLIHYEAELVFKVDHSIDLGRKISKVDEICQEYTLGIDFTARALQDKLKSQKLPWELAKSFDQSASIGSWRKLPDKPFRELHFSLNQNQEKVQSGSTSDMIFDLIQIVNFCTDYFSFQPGDLIFTGTPQGVGAIHSKDVFEGFLEDEKVLEISVL